ncbi:MAG: hypothetical protein N2110_09255 [Flavobacteriales bacterium]|nr:hypothetical protein [Flavobacteriales bacterium]
MKTKALFSSFVSFWLVVFVLEAQAPPQAINYQAVARDVGGNLITGPVGVRISIRSGSATGPVVYQETHSVVANNYGLFNLSIGQGTPLIGTFSAIDWSTGPYFAQVEVNPGSGYIQMGTQQMLSVPYALYAARSATADNAPNPITITGGSGIIVTGGPSQYTISANLAMNDLTDVNTAGVIPGQVLKWDGSQWTAANDVGGGVGDNWGTQVVQTTSTLSGNGTFANPLTIAQQGATNGQVLKWNGSTWAPANDIDTDTDAQTLSLIGNTLSISGGNSVTLPTGTTYTAGSGITITGNTISAVDASPTNEIQTLSLSGNTLTLSNGGGSVTLPSGGTIGGSGTVNYLARFTPDGVTLGNSLLRDNGIGVGLNANPAAGVLFNMLTGGASNGIYVSNTNAGAGSFAVQGAVNNAATQNGGYLGYSGNIAVGLLSVTNAAVYGQASSGPSAALIGTTTGSNTGVATIGLSNVWHGMYGYSEYAGASGVIGNANGASALSSGLQGFYTGNTAGAAAIFGYNQCTTGTNNIGVEGSYDPMGFGLGLAGVGFNGSYPAAAVDVGVWGSVGNNFNYSIYGSGNFAIVNGTKSASVGTSKGNQLLYCLESPEVWFEDFGQGRLVQGQAYVSLDPLFLETVFIDEAHPMIVTVTPLGDCKGLFVEPGTSGFWVRELQGGTSNIAFSWRVSCKRRHYQDHRFGADLAWPEGDTRDQYQYVPPRPIDYKKAYEQMLSERQNTLLLLTPRAQHARQALRLQR